MTVLSKNKAFRPCSPMVTGMGCVSAAGIGVPVLWQSIIKNRSSLVVDDDGFCLGRINAEDQEQIRTIWSSSAGITRVKRQYDNYNVFSGLLYSLEAINQAMQQAGWSQLEPDDGLIFATTTGQIPLWERELGAFLRQQIDATALAESFKHQPLALILDQIALALNHSGPRHLVTSACAASTHAIALADMWLRTGKVKRCLVGGTELLCDLTVKGFECFQLLSALPAKPFDEKRTGINLSEGAGFICLDAAPTEGISFKKCLALLSGGGISADAFHMTSPEPSGRGSIAAMQKALKSAKLDAENIDWVYAHGTGSPHNDSAESAAIGTVFGRHIPVTSTKAIHGHVLAASGVIESIILIQAMQANTILPTWNFDANGCDVLVNIQKQPSHKKLKHVLKNTLGFGGSNGCVIFSRPDEAH